jgi:uncharacterized protein YqeY
MILSNIKNLQTTLRKKQMKEGVDLSVEISLLTTLYAEAASVGKNSQRESTDAEVIATIKKFIKNNEQFAQACGDRREIDKLDILEREREVLESFIPKQLSDTELKTIIKEFIDANGITGPKGMGLVMKELKEKYDGLYDGKIASNIIKQMLT